MKLTDLFEARPAPPPKKPHPGELKRAYKHAEVKMKRNMGELPPVKKRQPPPPKPGRPPSKSDYEEAEEKHNK